MNPFDPNPRPGEHPAAPPWAAERYQQTKPGYRGHSVSQLRTIVGRLDGERLPTDPTDQRLRLAEHQAARDALTERSKEMGFK